MEELAALSSTAGLVVVRQFVQHLHHPSTKTMIGRGKVAEIGMYIDEHTIDQVVFDDELTPLQVSCLEKSWQCRVWDRSMLILHIFALHARTPQAKTQVELAQYKYLLPRLVGMWTHLSRQKGGVSKMRGPGEKELETDRRAAQQRIRMLTQRLIRMERICKNQRKQRHQKTTIALVGYTNAGKSSLMRCLSGADVIVANKLFATLSPTVRRIVIKQHPFLLADTVGFIDKLPHTLVACFKSTLAEVHEADFLVHVVDMAHPTYEQHIQVVQSVLEEIEAGSIPMMLVLNKQDMAIKHYQRVTPRSEQVAPNVFIAAETQRIASKYALPVVACSATDHTGIDGLKQMLFRLLSPTGPRPCSSTDRTKVS